MQPSGSLSLARIASLALPAGSLHGILACTCKFTMSASSPAGIPRTRRELSQLTVIQLRSLASQHGLTSTGRKSALVDRLYPLRNDSSSGRERSPNPHSSRSPGHTPARPRSPIADDGAALQLTVERLVERSLQGLEDRLRRTLQPATTASAADNISLPSPAHGTAAASDATAGAPTFGGGSTSAAPARAATTVQQPPIPDKIKQRIVRGEYIDFDSLLPEAMYPARYGAKHTPEFTLRLLQEASIEEGEVVIAQQKPASRRTIRDLVTWMEAWNLYAQVLVAAFPTLAPALLAYQSIICSASSRFPARMWLRYDQRFRASAAADSTIRWDLKHNELWLECFTQAASAATSSSTAPAQSAASKTRRPCTYCGSFYHYPDNCPSHPFRASRKRASSPRPSRPASQPLLPTTPASSAPADPSSSPAVPPQPLPHPCRDFNSSLCRRHICRFCHVCS